MKATAKVESSVRSILTSLEVRSAQDFTFTGFSIGDEEDENIYRAYLKVQMACAPLPEKEIGQRLAALAPLVTMAANWDTEALTAKINLYAKELQKYPADVVVAAIEEVKAECKFFPAYAEIATKCDDKSRRRFSLRKMLQKHLIL